MKASAKKSMMLLFLVAGLVLSGVLTAQFQKAGKLGYRPNVACMNGSPYGKVLVLIMQDPIETYVHKGVRHEDAKYLNEEGHEDEHAGHHHDHDGCASCEAEAKEIAAAKARGKQKQPLHREWKQYFEKLVAFTHRKTGGYRVTAAHEQYLQGIIEDKMRFSYELDPANNTNYESLYLYLTIDDLGKSRANPKVAYELAQRTIDYCKRDKADPASMLTGANAAGDVGFYMSQNQDLFTWDEVLANLADFEYCLKRYGDLLPKMVENGFRVSEARVLEMNNRAKYLTTRLNAQKKVLRRVYLQ